MRILLTGCCGQLGQELRSRLMPLGQLFATDHQTPTADRQIFSLDLTDRGSMLRILDKLNPNVIVNTAAWTAVDAAEAEQQKAHQINVIAPQRMAEWAAANNCLLFHYSTDYVFDGNSTTPWRETDTTNPTSEYGQSKLDGELAIINSGCRYIILRTSWVYSSHSNNFVRTMLHLAEQRSELQVVDDQLGCPTLAANVAETTVAMLKQLRQAEKPQFGVYHYTDNQALSWCGFAQRIFSKAVAIGLLEKSPAILPVDSSVFQSSATRPAYSVLDCSKISQDFGIDQSNLDKALDSCLLEILNHAEAGST